MIDQVLVRQLDLLTGIEHAVLRNQSEHVRDDAQLVTAIRRSVRSNVMTWLQAMYRDPLAEVSANDGLDAVAVAAEFRTRGLEDESVIAFRDGQGAAWDLWVAIGAEVITEPEDLRAFLTRSARSFYAYIDATVAAISDAMERPSGAPDHDQRRQQAVLRLLQPGAAPGLDLEQALGYRLDQHHLAAVVRTVDKQDSAEVLDAASAALRAVVAPRAVLEVAAAPMTRWLWIAGEPRQPADALIAAVDPVQGARLALGLPGRGLEGFRLSHREALGAQDVIGRSEVQRTGTWADLELPSLLLSRPAEAERFVARTLGEFASADLELRETVRAYLQLGSNASMTARRLHTHRNTIIGRIKRADALLPQPVAENGVNIACALVAARWLVVPQRLD